VVSALFLDIKGAFPSVSLPRLIHDMRKRGVPTQYTAWIRNKVAGRKTAMAFDGHISKPKELARGLDQGCPTSGIAFLFYNADLLDIPNRTKGEDLVAFADDKLLLVEGHDLVEAMQKSPA
jgi:hypothetical protein